MKNIFITIAALFFLLACDAPRENPFDPASPNYKTEIDNKASTQLFVHSLYSPFTGIPNVQVGEKYTPFFGTTNTDGRVQWKHEKTDSLFFILYAQGYFSNSVLFVGNDLSNDLETSLNARPQFKEIQFTSVYQNLDKSSQATYISISSKINDPDGAEDILSVVLKDSAHSFSDSLRLSDQLQQEYSSYADILTLDENLLPARLPELNFFLVVKNQNGDSVVSVPLHIKRVIEEQISLNAPTNNATLQDSVIFEWEPVVLDFPFTFSLFIQRLEDNASFVYSGLASTEVRFVVNNLTTGTYFWQLQIVDVLGNICQSIFMSFKYVR